MVHPIMVEAKAPTATHLVTICDPCTFREAFKKYYEGSDIGRTPFPFRPPPPSNGGDNKISKI